MGTNTGVGINPSEEEHNKSVNTSIASSLTGTNDKFALCIGSLQNPCPDNEDTPPEADSGWVALHSPGPDVGAVYSVLSKNGFNTVKYTGYAQTQAMRNKKVKKWP